MKFFFEMKESTTLSTCVFVFCLFLFLSLFYMFSLSLSPIAVAQKEYKMIGHVLR